MSTGQTNYRLYTPALSTWKPGDIITSDKWDSFIKTYPVTARVEFEEGTNVVSNFTYNTLMDYFEHNVICWAFDMNNELIFLSQNKFYQTNGNTIYYDALN